MVIYSIKKSELAKRDRGTLEKFAVILRLSHRNSGGRKPRHRIPDLGTHLTLPTDP